jgi:hypothetical protein
MTTSSSSGLVGSLTRQPWLLAATVGVIAFLVGWILMGWVIAPVQWVDATAYLRRDLQEDYMKLVAAQYAADTNTEAAARRIAGLGPQWREVLDGVAATAQGPDQARVSQLKAVMDVLAANNQMPTIARGPGGGGNPLGNLLLPLVGCLLVVAVGLGAVAGTLTNTILVVGLLLIFWSSIPALQGLTQGAFVASVIPQAIFESVLAAIVTVAVVAAWRRLQTGSGSSV